jgi:hypothetical protein
MSNNVLMPCFTTTASAMSFASAMLPVNIITSTA